MTYLKRDPAIPSPDTVIWRYMDDWKFEDLLKTFADQKQWNPPKPGTRSVYYNDPGQLWFGFPGSFGDENFDQVFWLHGSLIESEFTFLVGYSEVQGRFMLYPYWLL